MKIRSFILAVLLLISQGIYASEELVDTDILAQRGEGIVSQFSFEARVDKIPQERRQNSLRDRNSLQNMLNALLLNSQLAADARKAGFDTEKIVIERMRLAADAELAIAWLDHYVATQPAGNYQQLAHEYYLLNRDGLRSPESIDVSHILISTKDHSDQEAKELAESLREQLAEQSSLFDQFVLEYSEDPSASANKGKFTSVKRGDMVRGFEKAAFSLQEGEISSPVKSTFGYHIIRLDKRNAPVEKSFDEVKSRLIDRERKLHEDRVKQDYLSSLTSLDVSMSKEALDEMMRRQFGDKVAESTDSNPETE